MTTLSSKLIRVQLCWHAVFHLLPSEPWFIQLHQRFWVDRELSVNHDDTVGGFPPHLKQTTRDRTQSVSGLKSPIKLSSDITFSA